MIGSEGTTYDPNNISYKQYAGLNMNNLYGRNGLPLSLHGDDPDTKTINEGEIVRFTMLHGEQDVRVPIAQSYEMYQGLRHVGVDTEFVIYPREGHGIAETPHQRDLYRRALEWLNQRVKQHR